MEGTEEKVEKDIIREMDKKNSENDII